MYKRQVQYGTGYEEEKSWRQLDQFTDYGGNFIDTALVYGDWLPPVTGRSEKVIGRWLKETKKRSRVILSTKGAHPNINTMDIPRVTPACIKNDLEQSLKNLCTDYIDLYFLHRDDEKIPVNELIDCLEDQVRQGKIRYYGCSNWTKERIEAANIYAHSRGYQGFACNQIMMCLADVNEASLVPKQLLVLNKDFKAFHEKTNLNLMAYMAISKAYFKKRLEGRKLTQDMKNMYENPSNEEILKELCRISKETGYSINNLALQYIKMCIRDSLTYSMRHH